MICGCGTGPALQDKSILSSSATAAASNLYCTEDGCDHGK